MRTLIVLLAQRLPHVTTEMLPEVINARKHLPTNLTRKLDLWAFTVASGVSQMALQMVLSGEVFATLLARIGLARFVGLEVKVKHLLTRTGGFAEVTREVGDGRMEHWNVLRQILVTFEGLWALFALYMTHLLTIQHQIGIYQTAENTKKIQGISEKK